VVVVLVAAVATLAAGRALVDSAGLLTSQAAVLMRRTLVLEAQSTVEAESASPCPAGQLKSRTLQPGPRMFARLSLRDHPRCQARSDVRVET
jgi:hypothetical protein